MVEMKFNHGEIYQQITDTNKKEFNRNYGSVFSIERIMTNDELDYALMAC